MDDNTVICRILVHYLRGWGLHIVSATDGPKALALMRDSAMRGEPCDLAILDMQMPGMDGLTLARAIKAEPSLAGTQLVLLSSPDRPRELEAARQAGIQANLTKPVRQAQLYHALARVMGAVPQLGSRPVGAPSQLAMASNRPHDDETGVRAHVLVAEDNAVNQKVVARMLKKLRCRVDLVDNGLKAIEAFRQVHYTLVLMDWQMPEMDGFQAVEEIRREEGAMGHVPIIALTANAMEGDRERCLAAGMDDYLSKPVKIQELEAMLLRWIPQHARRRLP